MLIRKFKPADAAAVSDVIRQTMRITNSQDYSMRILAPLVEYFSPENVLLLSKERICLVAEIENRVVGTFALEDSELCAFFVHPDF
jgi:predicted N-acetyltransferase YhbS